MVAEEENDRVFLIFVVIVVVVIIIGVAIFVGFDFKNIEREISGGQVCTITADCGIGQYCSADDTCISTQACDVDNDCAYGQTCSQSNSNTKRCVAISCKNNSDCPESSGDSTIRCINSLCAARVCIAASDCSSTEACVTGICTPIGGSCQADSDCFRSTLMCTGGKCSQCSTTSDCGTGEYCDVTTDGGICKTGCTLNSQCGTGMTCVSGNCCPSGGSCGISCGSSTDCSGTCKHCVDTICTCIPGAEPTPAPITRFECFTGADCESGTCLPDHDSMSGQIKTCGWKAVECLYNNGTTGKLSTCPNASAPFCVQGVCQASSAGTICGTDGVAMCGNNLDCVNEICGVDRGVYGDMCLVTSDCEPGLTCSMNICMPATFAIPT